MKFENLSEEAQQTILGMIQHCVDSGIRMGMDEGLNDDGSPNEERQEIENFLAANQE